MKVLVGSSGLVGTSLQRQIKFDLLFNSKNINTFSEIVQNNSELYLSCLPAAKWQVNQNIWKDIQNIKNIVDVISTKRYSTIYLFSTIDVYCESPAESDENYIPSFSKLSYGANRYFFELLISSVVEKSKLKIIRLPALYNKYLKKNIIFDLLNNNNVHMINTNSSYQWLDLDTTLNVMNDLILNNPNDSIFNLFPPPIETAFIIKYFPKYNIDLNKDNANNNPKNHYNFKTKYFSSGYILELEQCKLQLGNFLNESLSK